MNAFETRLFTDVLLTKRLLREILGSYIRLSVTERRRFIRPTQFIVSGPPEAIERAAHEIRQAEARVQEDLWF